MRKASPFIAALALVALATPALAEQSGAFATAEDDPTTIIHNESGAKFPRMVAGFERVGEAAFDGRGEYVGVGYRRQLADGSPVTLRLAVVHVAEMTPREHFIIARPMVLEGLSEVKPVTEQAYVRPDKTLDGYLGIYNAKRGDEKVGVALWTFERGYWDLRGRVDFPQDKLEQTQSAVDAFVDAFVAVGQPYATPSQD